MKNENEYKGELKSTSNSEKKIPTIWLQSTLYIAQWLMLIIDFKCKPCGYQLIQKLIYDLNEMSTIVFNYSNALLNSYGIWISVTYGSNDKLYLAFVCGLPQVIGVVLFSNDLK